MKKFLATFALAATLPLFVTMAAAQQKPTGSASHKSPKTTVSGEKGAVMAVIKEFENDFNTGNPSWVQLCADQASIIDEFPPYSWIGSGACNQWGKDYDSDAKKNGVTNPSVWFGATKSLDVTGDRAYVVMPSSYSYKQGGKPVKEAGATLTVALQKNGDKWRITAWSWSRGRL